MALPSPSPSSTVVVSGASAGIGQATARALAREGYGLTLLARRLELLQELRDELEGEHGVEVEVHKVDLAAAKPRRRVVEAILAGGREVVGLVNNAGVGSYAPFVEGHEGEGKVVELNVTCLHQLTSAFLPPMVERGAGAVLNIGSVLGYAPQPGHATYGATKAFVLSFSEAVHTELSGTGVSCSVISPGPTRTDVFEASGAESLLEATPGIFWQSADDVAHAGVEAMLKGRRHVIPGLTNQLYANGSRFVPRSLSLPVQGAIGGVENVLKLLKLP